MKVQLFLRIGWAFGNGPSGLYIIPGLLQMLYRKLETPPRILEGPKRSVNYSIESIKAHLPLSLVPICGQERIDNGDCVCERRFGWLKVIQSGDARAVVFNDNENKEILVAFRPSNTNRNWVADMGARLVQLPGHPGSVKVHEGFLEHFGRIKGPLLEEIEWRLRIRAFENHTIHVMGYSMGGALATLAIPPVSTLVRSYHRNASFIAYASPRVGNQGFVNLIDSFEADLIRYTIRNDLVSLLPPRRFGYVHAGVEVHMHTIGQEAQLFPCDPRFDEDPSCSLAADNLLAFSHHKPNNRPLPDPIYC